MRYPLYFLVLALFAFTFSSCTDEDGPSPASMSINMNTVDYSLRSFNNSLTHETSLGQKTSSLKISTHVNGGTMLFTVYNFDWQKPPANGIIAKRYYQNQSLNSCSEISDVYYCDGFDVQYAKDNEVDFYILDEEAFNEGYFVINVTNPGERKVSGKFNFRLVNEQNTTDKIIVVGDFTNLSY